MFRKLGKLDHTDLSLWASSPSAEVFINEIEDLRDVASRAALKTLDAREAGRHDAYEKVIDMLNECRNMK